MAPVLEFPVQLIKHKVRQQRRQRATLRRALIRRVDQPVFHHPRGQIAADKLEQPLVGHPFRHQAHQHVVIDSIEELLQVDVHDPAMARGNMLLRARHRLMGRAVRPEAEAVLGERRVPVHLQDLQHRLLDKAVEYRRNTELADTAARFRDLDTPHRLRPVSPL